MSAIDKMAKSTVRIECYSESESETCVSIGSSFFFVLPLKTLGNVPVLITYRHVIEGFQNIRIRLSTASNVRQATSERARVLCFNQLNESYHPLIVGRLSASPIPNLRLHSKQSGSRRGTTLCDTPVRK